MYISKVTIDNFRSFYHSEVDLQEGLNVIIGENNTGKSNFITLINMLNNRDYKWTIYDFNMSLLKTRYKDFLTRPPKSKIIYRIEHLLDYNKEDSAMSKLMPFLIYNNDGEFVEEVNDDGQSDIVRIVAEIELLYEFDLKFLDNYKKEMEKVDTFDDFIKALKRLQSKFVVGFRKTTTNEYVERNVVNKIFEIE